MVFTDSFGMWIIPYEKQSEGQVRFGGGDFTSLITSYYPILGTSSPPCCSFLVKLRPCLFIPICRHFPENQTWEVAHKSCLSGLLRICIHTTSSGKGYPPSPFTQHHIILLLSTITFHLHVPLFHEWSIFLTLLHLRPPNIVFFFLTNCFKYCLVAPL